MNTPFRNTDKVPAVYPVHSIVSIFDHIEDAEAAVNQLDKDGFGHDVVYARGEEAYRLERDKNHGWLTHVYRAMQSVMSDEFLVIKLYEKKIKEGSSFILVPLPDPNDVDRVAAILKTHNVSLATYLGHSSFREL